MAKPNRTRSGHGLTPKQERFCIVYVYGHESQYLTQSGAYRLAYNCKGMSDKTVWEKALRLMALDKVGARIAELRNSAALQSSITREQETKKLERVYEKALNGDMTLVPPAVKWYPRSCCEFH